MTRLMRGALSGIGVIAVLTLTGCQFPEWGSPFAPDASGSPSAPVASDSPSAVAPSATPTSDRPTPSSVPSAAGKATGSLVFYQMPVSTKLAGTCSTASYLNARLSDRKNDFYESVDLTAVIDPTQNRVISVTGNLGADSEGFTWRLSYDSAAPAAGTSATLASAGSGKYTITGTLAAEQTRRKKTTTEPLPFTLTVVCKAS